ncbi:MAG: hypothetical protein CMJ81_20305 [Planctomycetaceae bacterium]|nr:hypothetical protein [Planctomycetaceae bacterium]MBP63625.1 hypothetical protein [Planctomycetaceae bacterium]
MNLLPANGLSRRKPHGASGTIKDPRPEFPGGVLPGSPGNAHLKTPVAKGRESGQFERLYFAPPHSGRIARISDHKSKALRRCRDP